MIESIEATHLKLCPGQERNYAYATFEIKRELKRIEAHNVKKTENLIMGKNV